VVTKKRFKIHINSSIRVKASEFERLETLASRMQESLQKDMGPQGKLR